MKLSDMIAKLQTCLEQEGDIDIKMITSVREYSKNSTSSYSLNLNEENETITVTDDSFIKKPSIVIHPIGYNVKPLRRKQ
jgi:hypothetical protein